MTGKRPRHDPTLFAALNVLTGEVFGRKHATPPHHDSIPLPHALERGHPGREGHPREIIRQLCRHKHAKIPPNGVAPITQLDLPSSRPPPFPGSTPSRGSSPKLTRRRLKKAWRIPLSHSNCRPPSTGSSPSITSSPSRSSGEPTRNAIKRGQRSRGFQKRWSQCSSIRVKGFPFSIRETGFLQRRKNANHMPVGAEN